MHASEHWKILAKQIAETAADPQIEGDQMRKQSSIIPLVVFLFFTLLASPCQLLAGQYQVTHVIDGDTIKVDDGTKKIHVRLVGIDAPETPKSKNQTGQPFNQRSKKHLSSLVLNHVVDINSYGFDGDGRMLGEIILEDKNINLAMVRAGLAEVYRGKPASGLDMELYWKAEEEAIAAKRGMWELGNKYVSPREWRRMHGQ
jgi:micrococcal nuclease